MAVKPGSVQDVVEAGLCAGCGICEGIAGRDAIEMAFDANGFLRPCVQKSYDAALPQIANVCPGISVQQKGNRGAGLLERLWGPVEAAWVGHATDPDIRWQASSGGVLSALLMFLLETAKVDYVIHLGADAENPLLPAVQISTTPDEVLARAGSRYAPTAPLVLLPRLLDEACGRAAFVGKPCDVAALRAYGRMDKRVAAHVPFFISFFCAGVPSVHATYDVIRALGLDSAKVEYFRYRGHGWPGRATAIGRDGRELSMSYDESWGTILGPRLQFRCKICPDGIGEFADVACGDAWHLEDDRPSFEEAPGQSLILCRTPMGSRLVEEATAAKYVAWQSFDLADLKLVQPYQRKRRQSILARLLALKLAGRSRPYYEGFYLAWNAWQGSPINFVRQFGGMLRRLLLKKEGL